MKFDSSKNIYRGTVVLSDDVDAKVIKMTQEAEIDIAEIKRKFSEIRENL